MVIARRMRAAVPLLGIAAFAFSPVPLTAAQTSVPLQLVQRSLPATSAAQESSSPSVMRSDEVSSHRFPPYPDLWSWDWSGYMKKGGSIGRVYKMDNGDYRFEVTKGLDKAINGEEKCCRLWDLFGQKFDDVSDRQLSLFEAKFRPQMVDVWAVSSPAGVELSDGIRLIRRLSIVDPRCYENFDEYYDAVDRDGKLIKSFYVVYVRSKPIQTRMKAFCSRSGEPSSFSELAGSLRINLAPLGDGTALIWANYGTFVLRLDKALDLKSRIGRHVFLVDAQALNKRFAGIGEYFWSPNKRQEVVLRYLRESRQSSK